MRYANGTAKSFSNFLIALSYRNTAKNSALENFKDPDSQEGKMCCHSFLFMSEKLYKTPNIIYKVNQM